LDKELLKLSKDGSVRFFLDVGLGFLQDWFIRFKMVLVDWLSVGLGVTDLLNNKTKIIGYSLIKNSKTTSLFYYTFHCFYRKEAIRILRLTQNLKT